LFRETKIIPLANEVDQPLFLGPNTFSRAGRPDVRMGIPRRTSGRASRAGRLSWRHTRRGAHYDLIPIRTTTRTPSTTRPFLHPFFATSTSIRADTGNDCSPVPRRRRRARRRPPVRGAAGGGDGAAALHPPRPLRAQTPPRSWSGSLGPARLSLGPPAPLPASAAAARSSTAPTWIPPLPTRIRGARRRLARGGGEKAAVCWLVSGSSLPSPALGARPGRCFPR
jgi:hypothetical protein